MADDTTATSRVVTIDLDDNRQVDALADALRVAGFNANTTSNYTSIGQVDRVESALKTLLPKPKPAEPTGLGAVAVDSRGDTYVRIDTAGHAVWSPISGDVCRWDDVPAVKIISEGVEL